VTGLQHEIVSETAPVDRNRSAPVRWLAGGLVVALIALVGLGTWAYLDHRGSSEERAAMAAVTAFMDAKNTHDPAAIAAATTADVVDTGIVNGRINEGPYQGTYYTDWFTTELGPTFHMVSVGAATMSGVDEIAVPTRVTIPGAGNYDKTGVAVYRVREVNGTLKVAEIVWLPWSSTK